MTISSEAPASFRSSAVRPGPIGLIAEGIREVASRRRLIGHLVRADVRKKGANTILGNVWWVVDPLLQMAVYVVLITVVFQRAPFPDYALFIFAAILPWKWFQSSISDAITSVTGADRLIKQIQFPKLVLPLASVVAGVVSFAFGLVALGLLMALLYPDRISPMVALIPAVAVVQVAFTLALAIALSSINVFYRDIGNLARHAFRLWFYLSPGLYSIDQLREAGDRYGPVADILLLNPFATLFTAYRSLIYDGRPPDWAALGALLAVSIGLVALATLLFKRVEPSFAKVL